MTVNKALGEKGERLAMWYLRLKGYKIIARNFSSPSGEIDLIAKDKDTLVFVEVRSKSSIEYGRPEETVDQRKQQKIKQTARYYLHQTHQEDIYCRFDVVAIVWQGRRTEITLYQDAF